MLVAATGETLARCSMTRFMVKVRSSDEHLLKSALQVFCHSAPSALSAVGRKMTPDQRVIKMLIRVSAVFRPRRVRFSATFKMLIGFFNLLNRNGGNPPFFEDAQ